MADIILLIAILIYFFYWALPSGLEFMRNKKYAFFERDGIQYKILKIICAYFIGSFYGVIRLIIMIIKILHL